MDPGRPGKELVRSRPSTSPSRIRKTVSVGGAPGWKSGPVNLSSTKSSCWAQISSPEPFTLTSGHSWARQNQLFGKWGEGSLLKVEDTPSAFPGHIVPPWFWSPSKVLPENKRSLRFTFERKLIPSQTQRDNQTLIKAWAHLMAYSP